MKSILFAILFTLVAFPVYAYELLMFSNPNCSFCQSFLKEVEPEYHSTRYAKLFPLRIINTVGPPPLWFSDAVRDGNIDAIDYTPTFVVWDEKKRTEIARLTGYVDKIDFYDQLTVFVDIFHGEKPTADLPSLNVPVPLKPKDKPIGPMNEFGDARVAPEGVINSRDLFQHMYKTPKEAVKASHWFGCHGTVHYHEKEDVWMPCEMGE